VLSKRLAEAMGGTLTVDSVEGQGTTFTLELALALEPA
jgi:signal transduction histidine kinase